MHATDAPPPPEQSLCDSSGWSSDPRVVAHESRNLFLLVIHQIVLRVGWIFKTESVIMPAFLDFLAGPQAGLLRGFMPLLNRLGQSLPPVFVAEWLQTRHLKRRALASFTCLMSPSVLRSIAVVSGDQRQPFFVDAARVSGTLWRFFRGLRSVPSVVRHGAGQIDSTHAPWFFAAAIDLLGFVAGHVFRVVFF